MKQKMVARIGSRVWEVGWGQHRSGGSGWSVVQKI